MKTNDKNSVKSQIINFRIAEIHEAIAQIKIHFLKLNIHEKSIRLDIQLAKLFKRV
jgi:3'-phosphoadenosine 5'-phosphosulfate sulfotransferase